MTTQNKKGFTIIEVVLVLAIAGLIFLMVFIALPALQRSQRNTQRKDDLARIITAITDYRSNNGGKNPFASESEMTNLEEKYIKGTGGDAQFRDPDGTTYTWEVKNVTTSFKGEKQAIKDNLLDKPNHVIYVVQHAGCSELENKYVYSAGDADVALFYIAEGKQVLCNDNH